MTLNRTSRHRPIPRARRGVVRSARRSAPRTVEPTVDQIQVNPAPQALGSGAPPEPAAPAPPSDTLTRPSRLGLGERIRGAMDVVYREMVKFGAIGAIAFVVDTYVYNLLRTGWWPLTEAPLAHKPLMSKVISVSVATVVAWIGNRYWTFRHRRRATIRSEFLLFVVMNVAGMLIAVACLAFSHYVLGLTSAVADNVSGNMVGVALGTLFRFWAYRQFVFTELRNLTLDSGQPSTAAAR